MGLPPDSFYVTCNGHIVSRDHAIQNDHIYNIVPRLLGGKGGFGSMLRAIGAQIEKTTSREACRDLSGRRMRDVNNEKQLRDWVGKQAEREKEREARRQERLERRRAMPNHKFDDPKYEEQKSQVAEQLEDALQTGLSRNSEAGPSHTATKRKADSEPSTSKKSRSTEWLGIDMDNLSSSDSDSESDSNNPPSTSSQHTGEDSPQSDDTEKGDRDKKVDETDIADTVINDKKGDGSDTVEEIDSGPELKARKESLLDILPPPGNVVKDDSAPTIEIQETDKVQEPFDLEKAQNLQDLIAAGLETLKEELTSRGLKCGGSLEQRAERLWAVKDLLPEQYPKGLLAKPLKGKKN